MRKFFVILSAVLILQFPLNVLAGHLLGGKHPCSEESFERAKKCPSDKPLSFDGKCLSCDIPQKAEIYCGSKEIIDVCQNREIVDGRWGGWTSRLKQCPTEYPLRDFEHSCVSCDLTESIYVEDVKNCEKCPNRKIFEISTPKCDGVFCGLKINDSIKYCGLKNCPETHPMQDFKGRCFSCKDTHFLNISKEECERCENRKWRKTNLSKDTEICDLLESPNLDRPLIAIDHSYWAEDDGGYFAIYGCDYEKNIKTKPENCALCPNRTYKDGECVIKK